ncbi:MAG: hypothetical protein K8W52_28720 [Deltaproteobacteria bacterium]|nr:hypothetical protein [Deltaproteobacteria bacterium]
MPRLWLCTLALAACGGGSTPASPDAAPPSHLDPPPAGQGVQYRMVGHILAGEEHEQCQFVQAPPEGLWVNRDEVRFEPGSHHFLLYATAYTAIPTKNERGEPVDTSGLFDCSTGATDGWNVTKLIGGSQNGEGDSMLKFPAGVAVHVPGNTVFLMNAHYVNATDRDLDPEVRINLWTVPEAQVTTEGDLLFLYNPVIKAPALGTGRARWRCPVQHDITIANVQSHMHRRGVGYEATVVGASAPFYSGTAWEKVQVKTFEPGLVVHAGEVLDYHCDYDNPENRTVYQGARSTDEMCMLIGSYYPVDRATAACTDAQGRSVGEWVGNGTASCAATLTCLQASSGLEGAIDCMDAASPAVAKPSSDVLNCFINLGPNDDPAVVCQAAFAACAAI